MARTLSGILEVSCRTKAHHGARVLLSVVSSETSGVRHVWPRGRRGADDPDAPSALSARCMCAPSARG